MGTYQYWLNFVEREIARAWARISDCNKKWNPWMGNGQQVRAAIWSLSGSGRGAEVLSLSHNWQSPWAISYSKDHLLDFHKANLKTSPACCYMEQEEYFLPFLVVRIKHSLAVSLKIWSNYWHCIINTNLERNVYCRVQSSGALWRGWVNVKSKDLILWKQFTGNCIMVS